MEIESAKGKVQESGLEARTVFIRNLPYIFTDSQLEEVFSEIGPVRRSFTVKEKGGVQHRGFGYVQFAVAEDALRAVKEKDGTVLHGRKVMVKLAQRRPSFEQRCRKRHPDKQLIKDGSESLDVPSMEKAPQTQLDVSTIMEKKKQEHLQVESQHDPSEPREKKKKKNKDKLELCKSHLKADVLNEKKSSEKQRVARTVVLGGLLSPEMREAVIERAKKAGSVESIQSSLSLQELKGRGLERDGCKMGAAAIVFTSVRAASEAVVELHQKFVGDGIVWARQLGGEGAKPRKWRIIVRNLPFDITEEKIRELFASSGFVWEAKVPQKDGHAKGFAFASFTSKANAEKAIHDMNGKVVQKRSIAVDWAVEKKAYQSNTSAPLDDEKERLPSDIEDEETASEDEEVDFAMQENPFFKGLDTASEIDLPASSEEFDLAKRVLNKVVSAPFVTNQENIESKQTNGENGLLPSTEKLQSQHSETKTAHEDQTIQSASQVDLQTTIFIKNLPFDVDANTLKRHFSAFGKVKSTYLVLHPKTKRPKGTAFLTFFNAESADAAIAVGKGSSNNDEFLTGISVGGRKLEILKAMEKKSVEALEKEKLVPNVVDRRNLYLLKEGKIEEGSPAAVGVSEQDVQKRRQLEQVKAIKLKSPNFHVSKTRLAVYNVPKSLKESELRKLFIDAVKLRATKQQPSIKQVKILRDEFKGDKSRGIAFVEFTEHQHALVALRVLNNNPETFGPDRRPIVEFAIENLQTLRKRQQRESSAGNKKWVDSGGNVLRKTPSTGEKKRKAKEEEDIEVAGSEGSAPFKKHRRHGKKLKMRQNKDNGESNMMVERQECGVNATEKGTSDSNVANPTKERLKSESKSNVGSSWKRKRRQDARSNEANEDTIKTQTEPLPPKMRKIMKRKRKRGDLETNASGFKQIMSTGESLAGSHNPSFGIDNQRKKQKVAHKKKSAKMEIPDKLDKLVAAYRDKYFSEKNQRKSSNDFRRWFE